MLVIALLIIMASFTDMPIWYTVVLYIMFGLQVVSMYFRMQEYYARRERAKAIKEFLDSQLGENKDNSGH